MNNEYIKENIDMKLSLRKKKINDILSSNRKKENFDNDNNNDINNEYNLNIDDIEIPQIDKITYIKKYFPIVITKYFYIIIYKYLFNKFSSR
jgi:hypothetical protein